MKTALAIIARNEEWALTRTLPAYAHLFKHKVAIDFESSDKTGRILTDHGFTVGVRPWIQHFGDARNACISFAEELGYDALLFLDADEAVGPQILSDLQLLEQYDSMTFSRVEIVDDFKHWDPSVFPDHQTRGMRLHKGMRYIGEIHEQQATASGEIASREPSSIYGGALIYHYGKCKPHSDLELKFTNYDRITSGLPTYAELPEGHPIRSCFWRQKLIYQLPHPLE